MWRRRLFTVISALSLLLCVAVCVLWARSYWFYDTVRVRPGNAWVGAVSTQGKVGLTLLPAHRWLGDTGVRSYRIDDGNRHQFGVDLAAQRGSRRLFGFAMYAKTYDRRRLPRLWEDPEPPRHSSVTFYSVVVPDWALALPAALPALILYPKLLTTRLRRRRGLCARCGYDLRASPDRCPECGTPAERGGP